MSIKAGECGDMINTLRQKKVLPSGDILEARSLDVSKRRYVFKYNKYIRYAHMATIEKLTNALGLEGALVTGKLSDSSHFEYGCAPS
eukprot:7370085-Pyramimonas_sp.AAC.2